MSDTQQLPLSVQPVISYPRQAMVGKTYLMTIELKSSEDNGEWLYEEEEYPIYCMVDCSPLFSIKPVGEPAVVLHRFGGSYGPAKFLLTAAQQEMEGEIRITLVNKWGIPVRVLNLNDIQILEAICDALKGRRAGPPVRQAAAAGLVHSVRITLTQDSEPGLVNTTVTIDEYVYHAPQSLALSASLRLAQQQFLRGVTLGLRRNPEAATLSAQNHTLTELGQELRQLCLPQEAEQALSQLVSGCPIGTLVHICFEADQSQWLGLPFEALRLSDGRLLATQEAVIISRRPLGLTSQPRQPLAGPLKILVAVGAPDEGQTQSMVLDQERELQNILDAVEPASRLDNAQVRILEVGHPQQIAAAIERDAYHILHLSCHGSPGHLELEDEEGRSVLTPAQQLISALRQAGRPLPLILLNACHSGVQDGETASLAETLLAAGIPAVLAMQTVVSDLYASALARAFYQNLASREHLLPSRALAAARKSLEQQRQAALQQGGTLLYTQPEYATATLFIAGEEEALANFGLDQVPLGQRPVYELGGVVPQLRIDDLIGRRKPLRDCLRLLRSASRQYGGLMLTGIGGVGKSTIAGRLMQRLTEDQWLVAAHQGRIDLFSVARQLGVALIDAGNQDWQKWGERLLERELADELRLALIAKVLAEIPLLLVLDDFEQNLAPGGQWLDPELKLILEQWLTQARKGRLLLTSRYPVEGLSDLLYRVSVGPLSLAESRKLLLRLPGINALEQQQLIKLLRRLGGHPRILEFLDALLRGGQGRFPSVVAKLKGLLEQHDIEEVAAEPLEETLAIALTAAARDICLEELLEQVKQAGHEQALLQLSVSNLPVTVAGLARMLAPSPDEEGDYRVAKQILDWLHNLALVHQYPDKRALVHRWTAEGIALLMGEEAYQSCCRKAGDYRLWSVQNQSGSLEDAMEAVRNYLQAKAFDSAGSLAYELCKRLNRLQQTLSCAAIASEVLETLPISEGNFPRIADLEATAQLALGNLNAAFERYQSLLDLYIERVRLEPERTDYQRELSVYYNRMGDLYKALGQTEQALLAFSDSFSIRQKLAAAEPNRADFQRDLSVSYEKMGNVYKALGQGEQARLAFSNSLSIAQKLAAAEPDRADFQRDLYVSNIKMGDLYKALGQGEQARLAFSDSLSIAQKLAAAEPDRADFQRDLSVSYERMGDLYIALGQGELARLAFSDSLSIRQKLAAAEPDRADLQRDLSVSYEKMGDLYKALDQTELARIAFSDSLSIRQKLTSAEPDRADYQIDLVISLFKTASVDETLAATNLKQALSLLLNLKASGRLQPADEPKIDAIEQMLAQLEPSQDKP